MSGAGTLGDTIWIASTRGPDDEPVNEITWGPLQWYASVADVRQTAQDLMTCAAYAEMMLLLITKVRLPVEVVRDFTTDLLRQAGRTHAYGTANTIELVPAGGKGKHYQREALVLFERGGQQGVVSAAEARGMARQWMEAAEATESDQLVSEALRATQPGNDAAAERLFGYLRKLRAQ